MLAHVLNGVWVLAVLPHLRHDVMITLGVFSALQVEMDLTFVAAILSVVGYSINDSIVVFDRVRENFRKIRRVETIDIIDISLTQTLSRTIMTSLTTLLCCDLPCSSFGGPSIHNFSLALLIGIGLVLTHPSLSRLRLLMISAYAVNI